MTILGWDIGGVNIKLARLGATGLTSRQRPFELQRDPQSIVRVLRELAPEALDVNSAVTCAVTMTAELSQMFRTKREGVAFVIDAVERAFPDADVRVFTVDGSFLAPDQARQRYLEVAAANWAATARLVASRHPTALLVDIGTTTTDIIPIVDGALVAAGLTDPDRMTSGELVYTGALRTPVEAIVRDVPYGEGRATVSAEGFALAGDVHLWRGTLRAADYSVTPPDGRPATREYAGERLARVVCADREMVGDEGISRIADAIAAEQVRMLAASIERVVSVHPAIRTAVVAGVGAFIADEAARAAGLHVVHLARELGGDSARYAPAAAVALLWAGQSVPEMGPAEAGHYDDGPPKGGHYERHDGPPEGGHYERHDGPAKAGHYERERTRSVEVVIKVGGGLLAHVDHLDRVLAAICELAHKRRVLVVPGGGPFADTVRAVDGRLRLTDDAAHWMAILAMDQYAYLLASRIRGAAIVRHPGEALKREDGVVSVMAPSRWLADADPLPHTWDVTSDSIAAWVAGEARAPYLVVVKPPGAAGPQVVDPYFERALPASVVSRCVDADEAIALFADLEAEPADLR